MLIYFDSTSYLEHFNIKYMRAINF